MDCHGSEESTRKRGRRSVECLSQKTACRQNGLMSRCMTDAENLKGSSARCRAFFVFGGAQKEAPLNRQLHFLTLLLAVLFALFAAGCSAAPQGASPAPAANDSAISEPSLSEASPSPSEARPSETASSADEPASEVPGASAASGYPVTVTDFLGEETTIEKADRIVSLTPSGTEVLVAEGAQDKIIGTDATSADLVPGAETVGDYASPDIEKITSLEPDVVIAANKIQEEAIEQLRGMGIPVVAAEPTSWEQVPESFELIAKVVDNREAGEELCFRLSEAAEKAEQDAPEEPVSCYYVLSYGNAGNWTSGQGTFINAMMEDAGGAPITAGSSVPWLEYPMEDLVSKDPECLILASGAGTLEDFVSTPGYSDLSAVKNGKVYEIDSDLVSVPGPRLIDGLLRLSEIMNAAADADAAETAEAA